MQQNGKSAWRNLRVRSDTVTSAQDMPRLLAVVYLLLLLPVGLRAAGPSDFQIIPEPYDQLSLQISGKEFTRYHFGKNLRRPFLYPVNGYSGVSLTRMGHPHDPESHSHHNSIWIAHNDVNGTSFWDDRSKGKIVHGKIELLEDGPSQNSVLISNKWLEEANGKLLLHEKRRIQTRHAQNKMGRWIIIDLELTPADAEVTFGKTPFGLIGVRMAKSIGVRDGGGRILNSEGGVNEKEIFWKRARWVDYSGQITSRKAEGITLMDHPSNPNYPNAFHVRNDGWMGLSLTLDKPMTISKAKPLRLRYGLFIHRGLGNSAQFNRAAEEFSELRLP